VLRAVDLPFHYRVAICVTARLPDIRSVIERQTYLKYGFWHCVLYLHIRKIIFFANCR